MRCMVLLERRGSLHVASWPALKGCVCTGRTREEALGNMKKTVTRLVAELMQAGLPVPDEVETEVLELEVSLPDPMHAS